MLPETSPNWFDVKELASGLFGIGEFGHIEEVISFLLVGTTNALLIDTGMGFYSMKTVVESVTKLPCHVINTHSHFDHVGSNFEFADIAMFDHPNNRRAASEGYAQTYLAQWASADQFGSFVPRTANTYSIPAFPHARFFKNDEILKVDPFTLEAIHAPGHCDDSVCFFESQLGWLFSGDLLYDGPIYIEKEGGLSKFRRSVEHVASLANLKRIFSSHNYFEFPLEKLQMLREILGKTSSHELEAEIVVEGRLRLVPS